MGEWDAYTSALHVKSLAAKGDTVLAATAGGLLIFDRTTETFTTLTIIDGLSTTNLLSLAVDGSGRLWLGGDNPRGVIQVYDLEQRESLREVDYELSWIRGFAVSDSVIFGAFRQNQDWGLIEFVYRNGAFEYRDVYRNWPEVISAISGISIQGDWVYVGTSNGLFRADWKHANLKNPGSWTRPVPALQGVVAALCPDGDTLLVIQERMVYRVDGNTLSVTVLPGTLAGGSAATSCATGADGSIWVIKSEILYRFGSSGLEWQQALGLDLTALLPVGNSLILGTPAGLAVWDRDTRDLHRFIPNGPLTNEISALAVLDDGRLVIGSRYGLAVREPQGWRNIIGSRMDSVVHTGRDYRYFVADTLPIDFGSYVADIEQGPDGLVYCAVRGVFPKANPAYRRRGGGIIILNIDAPGNYTLIDTSVLDYYRTTSDPRPYMVVKDLLFDRAGNLWAANTFATTGRKALCVRTPGGVWHSYRADDSDGSLSLTPISLAEDPFGRIWIGSFQDEEINTDPHIPNGGLAVLQYSGDPADPETVEWTYVEPDEDQETRTVWSLAAAGTPSLYVLTPLGLTGLTLSSSGTRPVERRSFTYFPNIAFGKRSKLRLDARQNVWVTSTSQGLHVLLANTTYWPDISGFRAADSDLLSDNINDIDFDHERGLAYLATEHGVSLLKMPFAQPLPDYSTVRIFPSPFHIPAGIPLTLDGLMDASTLKVMTLEGRVIRSLETVAATDTGYQATWDGKDQSGNWVGSGVYLLAVYAPRGTSAFHKITVIRH